MLTPTTATKRVEALEERYPPSDGTEGLSDRQLEAVVVEYLERVWPQALAEVASRPPASGGKPTTARERMDGMIAHVPTEILVTELERLKQRVAEAEGAGGIA